MKRIIARLDIKNNYLIKGINLEGLRKIGSPSDYATNYYDQGIDEIIYIDSVASLYSRKFIFDILEHASKNIFIPISVGGGISSAKSAKEILRSGADKICVNTHAVKRPNLIKEISSEIGSQSLVSYIESKKVSDTKWEVYTNNGREKTGKNILEWIDEVQYLGAGEILLTSVDHEGTKKGFDIELIENVANKVKVPLIINGGFGKLEHTKILTNYHNINALCISSVLHYNNLRVETIKDYCNKIGLNVRK